MTDENKSDMQGNECNKLYSPSTIQQIIMQRIDHQGRILNIINFSYSIGLAIISTIYLSIVWFIETTRAVDIFWSFILLEWIFCTIMLYYSVASAYLQSEMERALLRDYSEPSATTKKLLKDILIEIKQTASHPVLFKSVPIQKIIEFAIWAVFMLLILTFKLYE